jgi:hypothetical protein
LGKGTLAPSRTWWLFLKEQLKPIFPFGTIFFLNKKIHNTQWILVGYPLGVMDQKQKRKEKVGGFYKKRNVHLINPIYWLFNTK